MVRNSKYFLLLNSAPSDGNGSARIDSRPVKPVATGNTVPQEALGMTFDVEQLPEPDAPTVETGAPSDVGTKKGNENVEQVEKSNTDEQEKKVEVEGEYSNLPKGMKPPKKDKEKEEKDKPKDEKEKDKGVDLDKQVVPKQGTDGKAFDYSPFSQSEVTALKNMSVQSREWASGLLKKNKELAKSADGIYYQHPNGYVLAPEYNQLQNDVKLCSFESRHWETQLKLLKEGKKVRDFEGIDNKGQPIYGPELEPSDDLEEKIRHAIQTTYNVQRDLAGKVKEFPGKYKQQVTQSDAAVQAECKNRFAWVNDPKLMECQVTVKGFGDKSLSQIKKDFLSILPSHYQGHPMTEVAANFFIAMAVRGAELQEIQDSLSAEKTKVQEVRRAEPSSSDKPGKPPKEVHGVSEFVMDESVV